MEWKEISFRFSSINEANKFERFAELLMGDYLDKKGVVVTGIIRNRLSKSVRLHYE